ncbi:transmembrane protein 179-like [Tubulanus polymorphus]|uniref:transmembrane protein 179-like n=1 Tax=Tubulanus polymorphus TaxID=672921 RepID=UPI003DA318E2
MGLDFPLLLQTALYYFAAFLGLIVSISTGVTMVHLNGGCVLYNGLKWINRTSFEVDSKINTDDQCHFVIYFNVFACIIYGLGMAFYHTVAMCKRDKDIGTQMWVMPFLLLNSLVAVIQFIASCIMSVGFRQWCANILDGKKIGAPIDQCRDFQKLEHPPKGMYVKRAYDNTVAATTCSWIVCIVWLMLAVLSILRYLKNRRIREAGYYQDEEIIVEEELGA